MVTPLKLAQTIALQSMRNDGFSGHSGGHRVRQHTIVNVPTDPPKDHLIWSLFNFVYGNICCLGLVALIFSVKARDRKVVGDQEGARRHTSTICILNIVATFLSSLIFAYIVYMLYQKYIV